MGSLVRGHLAIPKLQRHRKTPWRWITRETLGKTISFCAACQFLCMEMTPQPFSRCLTSRQKNFLDCFGTEWSLVAGGSTLLAWGSKGTVHFWARQECSTGHSLVVQLGLQVRPLAKGYVIFAWQAANLMTMMYHTRNLEMNFHLGWVQWAWWNRMKHHPHFWRFLFIGVEPRKLCLSSTCSTTSTKALGRILQLLRFAFVWNLWETPLAVPLTSWHQTSSSTALKKRSPPITKRSQRNWLELKLVSRIGRMQHGVKEISRDWFFSGSVITAKGVLLDTRWTHCTWNASLKFECW